MISEERKQTIINSFKKNIKESAEHDLDNFYWKDRFGRQELPNLNDEEWEWVNNNVHGRPVISEVSISIDADE